MPTPQLLMKFKDKDTPNTVTRKTVKAMAAMLGLNETQLINYALSKLREELFPTLPDGAPELSAKAIEAIRARYGHLEARYKPSSSLIQDL